MNANRKCFLGFTTIFAILMAFVFWGTWSPEVALVMPDDCVTHPLSWTAQFRAWWNAVMTNGKFTVADVLWNGMVVSKYWLQEFKYASAGYFAALGLAYFLRGRGLSYLASYGAGTLLGFCGYWFSLFSAGHGTWFLWMIYGVVAFGFADRAVRFGKMRHWLLFGASVSWASFYQVDLWLLFAIFIGIYTLTLCAWERRFQWKGILLAAVTFAVIGAPSVWDAFANAMTGRDKQIAEATAQRSALTGGVKADDKADAAVKAKADDEARWIFVTNWSLPPEETFEFFIPRLNGDTSCPMTLQLARAAGKDTKPYTGALGRPINAKQGNYRQHSLYVGWITCLLAVVGVVGVLLSMKWIGIRFSTVGGRFPIESNNQTIKQSKQSEQSEQLKQPKQLKQFVLFFGIAAVVFWLFSMGRYCAPVYRIVYALPFGDYLRAPVKWHHLTEFCLCVLAGFGIEALLRLLSEKINPKAALLIVGAVVLFGAADLARIDKLYCAPIDMHIVRGPNAAADYVLKNGKGAVADLIEGGRGLLAWSFQAHEVGVTGNPNDEGVRFVWVGTQQLNQNQQLANSLKARATPVGYYLVTGQGIRSVAPNGANAALYQMKGVPPPPPISPWKKPQTGILTMGIVSLLGTLAALGVVAKTIKEEALS